MGRKEAVRRWLAAGAVLACILQVIGLLRYASRLPDDWAGITLYIVTIVSFALLALGFILQTRQ
jgi:hypothetical protein